MKKVCIVIDDTDQSEFIEDLEARAKVRGIYIKCIQFNPSEFQKQIIVNGRVEFKIDVDSLKSNILESKYLGQKVDLVACDYNFDDKEYNGFNLSLFIRSKRKNLPILFYSAQSDLVSNSINNIDMVKKLIHAQFVDFVLRPQYPDRVIYFFENHFSVKYELKELLVKYQMLTFAYGYPSLEGKKLQDILTEIDNETLLGKKYLIEMINLTVAHIIDLSHE